MVIHSNRRPRLRAATRRGIAALGAAALAVGTLAACGTQSGSDGEAIRIWAAHYTPTESMEASPDNPYPREALRVIADEWTEESGVEVEIVEMAGGSGTDERTWALTRLNSGDAPEIMNTQSFFAAQDKENGWWQPLDDYLEEPNPYIAEGEAGSERWFDAFHQLPIDVKRDADGELYVIPIDLVTTMFFYNKTAFEEAGVEPPETYAEFLDVMAAIQDETEYVPSSPFSFSKLQLGEMIVEPWKDQIEPTGIGGAYTMEDITRAILDGRFDADSPEYRDWLRLLEEAKPYWSSDWAVEGTDWGQRFTEGDLAILEDGTWRYAMLNGNDDLGFEWGTFFMPAVTEGTGRGEAPSADGSPAPSIGGASGVQLGITYSAEENDLVEEVVDFMKYLTAPDQMERMVGELGQYLPTAKDAEVSDLLVEPLEAVTNGVGEAGMILYYDKVGLDAQIELQNITTQYLQGDLSLEEAAQRSQDAYLAAAERNAAENGWN